MDADSMSNSVQEENETATLLHHRSEGYQSMKSGTSVDGFCNPPCSSQRQYDDIRTTDVIPEVDPRQDQPHYSLIRARIVSSVALVLYGLGPSSVGVVLPQYLDDRWREEAHLNKNVSDNQSVCYGNHNDSLVKQADDIQARVSILMTYLSIASAIPASFVCLLLGSYSDVIGRRKLLLSPILSSTLALVIIFVIIRCDLNVNYLYLAKGVDGLGGSFYTVLIAAFSISADISVGKSHTIIWVVALEAMARVTLSLGSITTGYLVVVGFDYAALFLLIPVAISFLVVLFLMPETRPKDGRAGKSSAWSNLVSIVRIYASEGSFRDRMALFTCLALFFLIAFTMLCIASIDTLYQMHEPFCWDSTLIGYYGAVRNTASALLGSLFIKVIQVCGWLRDEKIAMISTLFQVGGSIMEAFVTKTWTFFLVPVVNSPSFVSIGVIRGVMSALVGPFNQGAMFASIAVMETICNAVSTTALNQMYAATVSTMPGAVYLLLAGVGVLTFLLFGPFFYFYDEPAKRSTRTAEGRKPEGEENRTRPTND